MTTAKFTLDGARNNTEFILECLRTTLSSNPYDTEYQVDMAIKTDYGYYFHTIMVFYRGDKTHFDGSEFVCEEYIKIHDIPLCRSEFKGKPMDVLPYRKSDIERSISYWLN